MWEDRQDGVAGAAEEVDDEVADEEAAKLGLRGIEGAPEDSEDVVQAGRRGVTPVSGSAPACAGQETRPPAQQLGTVFANDIGQDPEAILCTLSEPCIPETHSAPASRPGRP
jgi:hypothetical protein